MQNSNIASYRDIGVGRAKSGRIRPFRPFRWQIALASSLPSSPTHIKPTPKTGNQVLYGTNGIRPNTKDSNLVPSALIIIQFVPSAVALLNVSLDYCFFLLIYLTNSSILIASWRFESTQFYLNDKMEKYNNI